MQQQQQHLNEEPPSITLTGHTGPVHHAVFSADGQYVLSGGADRIIRLWNPSTGRCIKSYAGHGKEVLGIAL